jgi:hypothetical protein
MDLKLVIVVVMFVVLFHKALLVSGLGFLLHLDPKDLIVLTTTLSVELDLST